MNNTINGQSSLLLPNAISKPPNTNPSYPSSYSSPTPYPSTYSHRYSANSTSAVPPSLPLSYLTHYPTFQSRIERYQEFFHQQFNEMNIDIDNRMKLARYVKAFVDFGYGKKNYHRCYPFEEEVNEEDYKLSMIEIVKTLWRMLEKFIIVFCNTQLIPVVDKLEFIYIFNPLMNYGEHFKAKKIINIYHKLLKIIYKLPDNLQIYTFTKQQAIDLYNCVCERIIHKMIETFTKLGQTEFNIIYTQAYGVKSEHLVDLEREEESKVSGYNSVNFESSSIVEQRHTIDKLNPKVPTLIQIKRAQKAEQQKNMNQLSQSRPDDSKSKTTLKDLIKQEHQDYKLVPINFIHDQYPTMIQLVALSQDVIGKGVKKWNSQIIANFCHFIVQTPRLKDIKAQLQNLYPTIQKLTDPQFKTRLQKIIKQILAQLKTQLTQFFNQTSNLRSSFKLTKTQQDEISSLTNSINTTTIKFITRNGQVKTVKKRILSYFLREDPKNDQEKIERIIEALGVVQDYLKAKVISDNYQPKQRVKEEHQQKTKKVKGNQSHQAQTIEEEVFSDSN